MKYMLDLERDTLSPFKPRSMTKFFFLPFLALASFFAITISPINNSNKFATYCNARFDYCIDYPAHILSPQPESENGDGRVFHNKKGEKALTVYGRINQDPDGEPITVEQQYNDDFVRINTTKGQTITYRKLGKTFFVLSGKKQGKIFYQKTILKGDNFAYAILEYAEKDKLVYDSISSGVFKSFK